MKKYPKPGAKNLITDIAGLTVGNAQDDVVNTGVTALISDQPSTASVHVMGGGPGTRDTELLAPENTVEKIDALFLSGGSAFGLDAGGGVQAWLRENDKGFSLAGQTIPLVPGAILFDLINGGDKNWKRYPPYRELGYSAAKMANRDFLLGSVGAGKGALTAGLLGGLGSASLALDNGITLGALVAVNALGSVLMGSSSNFWAAPFEIDDEFGGKGLPDSMPTGTADVKIKFRDELKTNMNTTIAIIATDAVLTKSQAKRLAIAAHDGIARAIWPSHTPLDGDLVFSLATGASGIVPEMDDWIDLGAHAASTMSRAIARGIFEAVSDDNSIFPAYRDL
ncbi:MAG: P1 family peptidase [Hyphomicrobiales bacterium]|nr:P1 family peptidase [Hyphomicrobiales bacterium]